MNVLVLNSGSSSLKFQVIRTGLQEIASNTDVTLASGILERIGSQSLITLRNAVTGATSKSAQPIRDHRAAIDHVLRWLVSPAAGIEGISTLSDIQAVGHRVVHGGERFAKSVVIDPEVLKGLDDMIDLAPLHNPANIAGIKAATEVLGAGIQQAAVFDTAFHHTLPEHSYLYAIPYQYYRRYKVRRYGFHGTSHRYVSYKYRTMMNIPREEVFAITLHLGNGCSACAISRGNSIDTSMGMTPLEGLVMGTRAGDIDPAIMDYLSQKEGVSLHEIDSILNRSSGLLGISGLTHDMRELIDEEREHDDRRSRLAIEIFCYRVKKYIGAYITSILSSGADPKEIAIIFTGGIGENSAEVRKRICSDLSWLGLTLDQALNESMVKGKEGPIGTGRLRPYVIPTNEELLIARDTVRAIKNVPQRY